MSDYITIQLSKTGKYAGKYQTIVSIEDAELDRLNWRVLLTKYVQYACRMIGGRKNIQAVLLHREVMKRKLGHDIPDGMEVDHIDGDGLNNTRDNLRLATHSQNNSYRGKYKRNTSGYKGVTWDKEREKWVAQIRFNKKNIFLGRFDTREDAYKAYCEKALELQGDFAKFD